MKKHLLLLLGTACIGITELCAQNWVNGGNSLAANGSLGTNTNFSLIFKTNNTERGRITNGGNWGIGTSTAPSKLGVNSASGASPFRAQIAGVNKFIVNSNGGVTIGSSTAGPTNGLYVAGSVGIGTNTINYKLNVQNSGTAIYGNSTNGGIGVWGSSNNIGVYGGGSSYGVYGLGGPYGVYGTGSSYGVYGSGLYGVYGYSSYTNGDALHCQAISSGGFGVYASSSQSYGIYATTSNSNSYAGYFSGRVYSSGGFTGSDSKLKEEIVDVSNAMDVINQLKPKSYKFRQDGNYKLMNLPQGKHYGLIAQDVEQVLPGLVADADFNTARIRQQEGVTAATNATSQQSKDEIINFKALNYTELIPIIVKAMQEQQQVIDQQQKMLNEQQQQINELKGTVDKLLNTLSLTGNNLTSAFLKASIPNPAQGTALIQYYVPQNSRTANIVFTDIKGAIIKSISISNKGEGQTNVNTAAWTAGTYTYTLYINGTQTDSKKLVIAR